MLVSFLNPTQKFPQPHRTTGGRSSPFNHSEHSCLFTKISNPSQKILKVTKLLNIVIILLIH
jgi:hypothetical protein